ncbi:MAG: AAA family ATPase [Gemmatimonadota bacterium]
MPTTDLVHDIEVLVRARYGLIVLPTSDEARADALLAHVADAAGLPFFTWTRSQGLRRADKDGPVFQTEEPAKALTHIASGEFPAVYHFKGLDRHLADDALARRLEDAAVPFTERRGALVLTGDDVELPPFLQARAATAELPPPRLEEYRHLLAHIVRDMRTRAQVDVQLSPRDLRRLLVNLQGLTLLEAEKTLTKAIIEDGRLSADDIARVIEAKREIVERDGLLEYYPVEEGLAEVADMARLKEWLVQRRAIIAEPDKAAEHGLPFPKGVLLLGVPGCGKSLCAKAVSTEWRLPLLKLDPSNLYNKYIGESERNFTRAIRTAERMAPVILWIDELEKAFSAAGTGGGASGDDGVSQRIFGTFLSWLQDRRGDVFVVATANDVSRLAPEFLRKGRFDEIFFVDLPDAPTRREIFEIHLRSRNRDAGAFDLDALAAGTDGFSGAEIEQIIVSGLYDTFADDRDLTTAALLRETERTRPLSRTMAEKVAALRRWAETRTVRAN